MGQTFKCTTLTTYKGRIMRPGTTITVRDEVAKTLDGHPCWELMAEQSEAPKAPKAKKGKDESPLG